jgi:hypothetical protein
MDMEAIQVVRDGKRWAVMHKGGYLGFVNSHEEAVRLASELAVWPMERACPMRATLSGPSGALPR